MASTGALNLTIRVRNPAEPGFVWEVHSWPSGLRRYVKAVISPDARVRTPQSARVNGLMA